MRVPRTTPRIPFMFLGLVLGTGVGVGPEPAWPADVPGWVKPKPGEHPRLRFRQEDVADLKKRAETPEGKAISRRLRFLLDGKIGDTLLPSGQPEHSVGAFTITAVSCSTSSRS